MTVKQETIRNYYLAFYEDGRFSNYIGDAYSSLATAKAALIALAAQMRRVFPGSFIISDDELSFSYDRYSVLCVVRIIDVC